MAEVATILVRKTRVGLYRPWLVLSLVGAGLLLRLRLAWMTFLNPDEALHYFIARQSSAGLAYRASLATAHPPLMILFLTYWSRLGNSEFFLRLPFVVAGVLFCWIMFLWLREISNQRAALYGLALSLFLPSLISLSGEIRQYALLLLFSAACLYSLERALDEGSVRWTTLSMASLYLALATHYSALVFLAAVGIYGLLRLIGRSGGPKLVTAWIAGQAGAALICGFLFRSQVSHLRQSGLPAEIAQTWLRTSIFQRGQDQVAAFAWSRTVRLFRYFFSHGTIGVFALLLFLSSVARLLWSRDRDRVQGGGPALVVLLLLPFLITLGAALAGVYPYGGTRHDVVLAVFAIPGVALALAWFESRLKDYGKPLAALLLAAGLIIANLFPSPSGPYMAPRNQDRRLMRDAITFLQSLPADSVLLTDRQGGLVLNFYLCREAKGPAVQQQESLVKWRCGNEYVLSSTREETLPAIAFTTIFDDAWRQAGGPTTLYLFQSGWIEGKEEDDWLAELQRLGGSPRSYGPNILICAIVEPKPIEWHATQRERPLAGARVAESPAKGPEFRKPAKVARVGRYHCHSLAPSAHCNQSSIR